MADTRSPEDVLAGVIRIAVGGQEKLLPTLSIRGTRDWQAAIAAIPGRFNPGDPEAWTATEASEFSGLTLDVILDIITLYDRNGALGGRDWLEEHADPAQLYAALAAISEVAFPFADNTRLLLAALVAKAVVGSPPPNSTSGPSPTGTSRPARSRKPSIGAS
jgi:hypothetical protein